MFSLIVCGRTSRIFLGASLSNLEPLFWSSTVVNGRGFLWSSPSRLCGLSKVRMQTHHFSVFLFVTLVTMAPCWRASADWYRRSAISWSNKCPLFQEKTTSFSGPRPSRFFMAKYIYQKVSGRNACTWLKRATTKPKVGN